MNNNNMFDIIKRRSSMRSYDNRALNDNDKQELERILAGSLGNPFGASVRLPLMESNKLTGQKLGTYGVIHGASLYIACVAKSSPMDIEGLGYSMEHAVLGATAMGLGTCWLAGTYDHNAFKTAAKLVDDERVIAVSPVGYPAERRTLLDTMMRGVAGSAKRKTWNELFFDGTPSAPLGEQAVGAYHDALEALRLAPSGSNGKPWRVIKQGNSYHFYRQAKPGSDAGRIDMGIGACHFELMAREAGLAGEWKFEEPKINLEGSQMAYFATWALD
jgi:nitroreductase